MPSSFSNTPPDILSSWIAQEVLFPQTFNDYKDLEVAYGKVFRLEKDPMPWTVPDPSYSKRDNYKVYYHVVLDIIDYQKAISVLVTNYADRRVEKPGVKKKSMVAVILVDDLGHLVNAPSVSLSSFAWGFPIASVENLRKLENWATEGDGILKELDTKLRDQDKNSPQPLSLEKIDELRSYIIDRLGLQSEYLSDVRLAIRVEEYQRAGDPARPPDPLILNSFYLNDLLNAKDRYMQKADIGNLPEYLGLAKPAHRWDLLNDRESLESAVAPSLFPPGRWPGPGRHPLVFLQQTAVNLALKELEHGGILAVNGPPGTGKTTLLRDVVAALVTRRAEAMLTFEDPADAFKKQDSKYWIGAYVNTFYKIDDALRGFEMLIASSNNMAVENVSGELPGIRSIAEDAPDLRYFNAQADALHRRETWGLIAAVLGKSENRNRFKSTFWWNSDPSLDFKKYLRDAHQNHQSELLRWTQAKKKFQTALKASRTALSQLEEARQAVLKERQLAIEQKKNEANLQNVVEEEAGAKATFGELQQRHASMKERLSLCKTELDAHGHSRPGFFSRLFRTASFRVWNEENKTYANSVKTASIAVLDYNESVESASEFLERLQAKVQQSVYEGERISANLTRVRQQLDQWRSRLDGHLIDDTFFLKMHAACHTSSPWCDDKTQRLRDDVFVAAMELHQAFIGGAADPIRNNLGILMDIFSGKEIPDPEKRPLLTDLWTTLFLIVPALSTTFASVERMLGGLPAGSIGWLLIDEAAQALPQAAVGTLMRTRRAIVVGDPMQIEPVVALPPNLTRGICREFGVNPDVFNAPQASVQTLADSATPYFAKFSGAQGSREAGIPLLVHRRCSEPMFSISNQIAYDNLMVQAKQPGISSIRGCLGPSSWINVPAGGAEKWNEEEGKKVLELLEKLKTAGVPPDLYIISPFINVTTNMRRLLNQSGLLPGWAPNINDSGQLDTWLKEHIGTVHTFQGREIEAVIFVLGASLPTEQGARNWAGASPNILNVAITRAKEALYVVGNRDLWSKSGAFEILSGYL